MLWIMWINALSSVYNIEFNKLTQDIIKRDEGAPYNFGIFNNLGICIAHENKDFIYKLDMAKENESTKKAFSDVVEGKSSIGRYNLKGKDKVTAFIPFSNKKLYICASETVDEYTKPINNVRNAMLVIGFICLLLALIAAFIYSRSISSPLLRLADLLIKTSEFDLIYDSSLESLLARKDELGVMVRSLVAMRKSFREMANKITTISGNLASHSEELTATTEENTKSISQVAVTINQMAESNSSQAETVNKTSEAISGVVKTIDKVNIATAESVENAAKEITEIIKGTTEKSRIAADNMNKAKVIVDAQADAVKNTKEVFDKSKLSVEDIVKRAQQSAIMLKNVDTVTKEIGNQAQEMAAAAEQYAASMEEISASSEEQWLVCG